MNRALIRLAAIGAVVALGGAACSSDSDDTAASDPAAKVAAECDNIGDPNVVTVYSGRAEKLVKPLLDQVDESILGPGIRIEAFYDQKPVKILEEGSRSPADVWYGQDAGELGALAKHGYLGELPDSVTGLVPATYVDPDKRWTATTLRSRVLAYDPAQVPEAELPGGIDALVENAEPGTIGYAPTNASWKSFVTALRVLRGEDGAREWLTKFKDAQPTEFANNGAVLDAVDQGQVKFGLINHYYWFQRTASVGAENVNANIHYFKGDTEPGALVNIAAAGILNCANSTEAAGKLVQFLLSEKAQQYFADETGEYPVIEGVQSKHALPALTELDPPTIDLNQLESLEATEALLRETGLLK
ncbi:extracellular solute-binding protein [Nocardia sp. NPDC058176]|uniref:extracellular solute-binding protein n=1 Tax=Nocardia sp. NPDC058176 TaxID=3346368 RepID=UPI0036D86581